MASQIVRKITNTTINEPINSLENGDIIITNEGAYINVNGKYVALGKVYDDTDIKKSITDLQTDIKNLQTDNTKNKSDITDLDTRLKALETPAG